MQNNAIYDIYIYTIDSVADPVMAKMGSFRALREGQGARRRGESSRGSSGRRGEFIALLLLFLLSIILVQ